MLTSVIMGTKLDIRRCAVTLSQQFNESFLPTDQKERRNLKPQQLLSTVKPQLNCSPDGTAVLWSSSACRPDRRGGRGRKGRGQGSIPPPPGCRCTQPVVRCGRRRAGRGRSSRASDTPAPSCSTFLSPVRCTVRMLSYPFFEPAG